MNLTWFEASSCILRRLTLSTCIAARIRRNSQEERLLIEMAVLTHFYTNQITAYTCPSLLHMSVKEKNLKRMISTSHCQGPGEQAIEYYTEEKKLCFEKNRSMVARGTNIRTNYDTKALDQIKLSILILQSTSLEISCIVLEQAFTMRFGEVLVCARQFVYQFPVFSSSSSTTSKASPVTDNSDGRSDVRTFPRNFAVSNAETGSTISFLGSAGTCSNSESTMTSLVELSGTSTSHFFSCSSNIFTRSFSSCISFS